ncbi:MAG TPA: M48 family metallopeptidase [Chthoniobacterales bacterium]|jgi:predicted Zn-dependent protease
MKSRTLLRLLPLFAAGLFVLFQYLSAEKFTNPLTGKAARVALSREQEDRLGLQAYREVLSEERVVKSGPQAEQVRRVAERLASATGADSRGFQWAESLVQSPQKNAFCLPGGKIVVYTGILPITQTDAGLAAVMGHEMAHATLRHGGQRVLRENLTQTLLSGAALSISDMDYNQQRAVMAALGAGAKYGAILPFGRAHESEADELGLLYMARAGYDPREAIAFWQRMAAANKGQPPEFLSTHPSSGTRIERLKAALPKALAEYEGASVER